MKPLRRIIFVLILLCIGQVWISRTPDEGASCPQLLKWHLPKLRSAKVVWDPLMENGTAYLDLRGGSLLGVLPERIGKAVGSVLNLFRPKRSKESISAAVECFLSSATLAPGKYSLPAVDTDPSETFELTEQHIRLLKKLRFRWLDFYDAPAIDPKRPFGDMSFFELDMNDILGIAPKRESTQEPFTREELDRFEKLHREMQQAVQIYLREATVEGE